MTVRQNPTNKIAGMQKQLAEAEAELKKPLLASSDRAYFEAIKSGAELNIRDYEELLRTSKHLDDQIDQ